MITPGELHKGMLVTVLENKPFETPNFNLFGGETKTITIIDRSGMGEVHTVLAISLPFVIVRRESKHEGQEFTTQIDTRRTTLIEISREYAESLIPNLFKRETRKE